MNARSWFPPQSFDLIPDTDGSSRQDEDRRVAS